MITEATFTQNLMDYGEYLHKNPQIPAEIDKSGGILR
jgi:hypothetical protein